MDQVNSRPAGFWIRLLANILDSLIVTLPLMLISWVLGDEQRVIANVFSALYVIIAPVYSQGYTIGKKIVGIRIVRVDGTKIGIGTMLLRTVVAAIVYGITLGMAVIASVFMVGFRQDKRAVHDLIAGTQVVHR